MRIEREKGKEQRSGTARNIAFKFPQGRKEIQPLIEALLSFHLAQRFSFLATEEKKKKRRAEKRLDAS